MSLLTDDQQRELIGIMSEVKNVYAKVLDDNRTLGRGQADTCVKLDRLTDDVSALHKQVTNDNAKRLDSLEAAMQRRPGIADSGKQLTAVLIGSKELSGRPPQLARGQSISLDVEVKTILGISRQMPYQTGRVGSGPSPVLRLRAMLPVTTITAGAIQYLRETGYTNAAAPVAEGAPKPQSDLTYVPVTAPVETIAHYTKISKQNYEDLPQLAAALEARLIAGLLLKEENQLLNGSGVSPQLQGFMTVAGAAAAAPTGSTLVDAIALAAGELSAAGYNPTGAVVASADWTVAGLEKDTLGQYIALPAGLIPPVIVSPAMAAGSFLVGDFSAGCTLFEREYASIQVANQNEDDFTKNLYTALAELREVLAIYQAGAFLKGTVPAGAAASASRAPRKA